MKQTRSGSMMSYITLEDDTAAVEMLAFSNVLDQFGGYLRENSPVVVTGRLSLRDDKDPQIVINRARPMSDFAQERPEAPQHIQTPPQILNGSTLYLKLTGEDDPRYRKVRAILNMFPGEGVVKVFFADTRKMRGTRSAFDSRMLGELERVLGRENVVLK
jgi:DNA polymerase-3 subunit alpha